MKICMTCKKCGKASWGEGGGGEEDGAADCDSSLGSVAYSALAICKSTPSAM